MADDLASGPAIAETTSQVEATEPDGNVVAPVESGSAPEDAKPSEPVRDKVQERFDKITKEKYDALRRADQLEYRLQQLEAKQEAPKQEVAPPKVPTLESVGYDEGKFQAAIVEFARAEAKAAALAEIQAHQQKQTQQSRQSDFEKRQAEFATSNPEYVEKVMQNDSLPISPAMAEVIRESELGPQVALWLANNADKAASIAMLPPIAAARELGRIEARIEQDKAKPVPVISKAPPPPAKIEATDPSVKIELDSPEAEQLSDAEWTRRRNLQIKRQRENRNR